MGSLCRWQPPSLARAWGKHDRMSFCQRLWWPKSKMSGHPPTTWSWLGCPVQRKKRANVEWESPACATALYDQVLMTSTWTTPQFSAPVTLEAVLWTMTTSSSGERLGGPWRRGQSAVWMWWNRQNSLMTRHFSHTEALHCSHISREPPPPSWLQLRS